MRDRDVLLVATSLVVALGAWSCGAGQGAAGGGDGRGGRGSGGGGPGGGGFPGAPAAQVAAVPVEVEAVTRRAISDYLETSGTLEAESEVDIVARTSGPVVELVTEEGRFVEQGALLARIDDRELSIQLEVARVNLEEARLNYQRAQASFEAQIIPRESFDTTKARFESAAAQIKERELQLAYTEIRAPFSGLVIERAVKLGQFVNNGTRLFRISDFSPLLCSIQLPEKELNQVRNGQRGELVVESYPGETFVARVLRINPVIDAANGTFRVTLEVDGRSRLRPGMFATVRLETDVHPDALVIPKAALVLESIGDTVYIHQDGVGRRRDVELGYQDGDRVEVLSGLELGDQVIVVGQDSLSDGAAVYLFQRAGAAPPSRAQGGESVSGQGEAGGGRGEGAFPRGGGQGSSGPPGQASSGAPGQGPPGAGRFDPRSLDWNDPQQVERAREMMRQRGLSDEQIEERLRGMRERVGSDGPPR